MTLLCVENLRIEFPSRHGIAVSVNDVSFELARGEILGLVGESGAGKSTIGNAIINLLSAPGRIAGGSVVLDGEPIQTLQGEAMRQIRGRRIGFIFQDPMTSLNPLLTIGTQLMETVVATRGASKEEAEARALELLEAVGIPEPKLRLNQYPHQFSGGMRQRVVIAIALAGDPELIIADEPTTALDVSIQNQVLELIRKLCKERDVGCILITHDMGVIANTTDRVAVLYQGELMECGPTMDVLERPQHDYTRSLISAVPRSDVKVHRFPQVEYIEKAEELRIDVKNHWLGQKESFGEVDHGKLLEVKDVDLRFVTKRAFRERDRRYVQAIDNVSFHVKEGETFGLVGESGSGKSTTARVIAGLYRPDGGQVYFAGKEISGMSARERRPLNRQIQMIFQNPYSSLNARMTVANIIAEPIRFHQLASSEAEVRQIVNDLLDHVGLGKAMGVRYPHEFSGGQRQRISIARALATRPRFLICDEPTSALDVSVQAQILNLLKDLQEELGLTMLFISHDLPVIRQMCDRIAVMKQGAIVEINDSASLFTNPENEYTRNLIEVMPHLDHLSREGLELESVA
ncbi:ABC transporter ATP-binding protein [Sansalvadorimonas sp. 2012CJ34-2]|uniref:ABC transporter ATP-binding protein n=1 Tax=Parendozoicomonas callyspongiae TaxID=2942213 RepID=A0ABT0PFX7_9GAMM|nr:ABC transporter ATP-binding protein [Sansalvadorimonas sp. 2012CJ34-2]MCL6269428.1 ABC transporter ATP-binding protein [Sansalvadorimonas sp. 2012CJ34-2]